MKIEIKIECKGSAAGTLGWFNQLMQGAEFVIKNTSSGTPGMFLRVLNKEKKGGFDYYFICRKWNGNDNPMSYRIINDFLVIFITNNIHQCGLFDIPLTPACEERAEEMIQTALEKFTEWWEEN